MSTLTADTRLAIFPDFTDLLPSTATHWHHQNLQTQQYKPRGAYVDSAEVFQMKQEQGEKMLFIDVHGLRWVNCAAMNGLGSRPSEAGTAESGGLLR